MPKLSEISWVAGATIEEDTGEMKVKDATACIPKHVSDDLRHAWDKSLQRSRPIFVALSNSWGSLDRRYRSTSQGMGISQALSYFHDSHHY